MGEAQIKNIESRAPLRGVPRPSTSHGLSCTWRPPRLACSRVRSASPAASRCRAKLRLRSFVETFKIDQLNFDAPTSLAFQLRGDTVSSYQQSTHRRWACDQRDGAPMTPSRVWALVSARDSYGLRWVAMAIDYHLFLFVVVVRRTVALVVDDVTVTVTTASSDVVAPSLTVNVNVSEPTNPVSGL